MFKLGGIYFPKDEKMVKQIYKDIAAFHCAAAVKYMNSLNLNEQQKVSLLTSLAEDIAAKRI
jgi:hypothetical protein